MTVSTQVSQLAHSALCGFCFTLRVGYRFYRAIGRNTVRNQIRKQKLDDIDRFAGHQLGYLVDTI